MSSLREVKDRIASVRSTLKITSAMKLVASSKLRKAQRTIESLRPYEEALSHILSSLQGSAPAVAMPAGEEPEDAFAAEEKPARTVVVAVSSNTSMCGAFNANVIKLALETVRSISGAVEVWSFGRKMTDAFRKEGMPAARDFSGLVAHPSSDGLAAVSRELREMYEDGRISGVVLVYSHFVSTGRQVAVRERFLPFEGFVPGTAEAGRDDGLYILEPSGEELLLGMVPQVLDLKLYAAILDSAAAEHAARMVAMQAATDNAQDLLSQLTLEYNKGRQQKITSEILDLVAGENRN